MDYPSVCTVRRFCCLFTVLFSLFFSQTTTAQDSTTIHRFKPGEVLSSDVMNDILDQLDNVTYGFTHDSDLVGTWQCKTISSHSYCITSDLYTADQSGLYATLLQDVTFAENPDGTYSYSTSKAHMFDCVYDGWNLPVTQKYAVVEGSLILRDPLRPNLAMNHLLAMRKISDTKIILDPVSSLPRAYMVVCERKTRPPDPPTDLDALISDRTVSLIWRDNSIDETSFMIMRKDFLDDEYREIGSASQDAAAYTDSVPGSGDYWYRVKATNQYGDSIGSNVIKVTVP